MHTSSPLFRQKQVDHGDSNNAKGSSNQVLYNNMLGYTIYVFFVRLLADHGCSEAGIKIKGVPMRSEALCQLLDLLEGKPSIGKIHVAFFLLDGVVGQHVRSRVD